MAGLGGVGVDTPPPRLTPLPLPFSRGPNFRGRNCISEPKVFSLRSAVVGLPRPPRPPVWRVVGQAAVPSGVRISQGWKEGAYARSRSRIEGLE